MQNIAKIKALVIHIMALSTKVAIGIKNQISGLKRCELYNKLT